MQALEAWRLRPEWPAFGREFFLELFRAIATAARPRFRAIDVAAAAARMRLLDFEEVKIFLPVGSLFSEWLVAIADLDPLHPAVFELARFSHVSEVFTARNRSPAQRSIENRTGKCFRSSGFYFCGNEVAHLGKLYQSRELHYFRQFNLRN